MGYSVGDLDGENVGFGVGTYVKLRTETFKSHIFPTRTGDFVGARVGKNVGSYTGTGEITTNWLILE